MFKKGNLIKTVLAYAKQETFGPLKSLGRWALWGFLGSLLIAASMVFFLVGTIRLLQTETGSTFAANWSWAPYLISLLGLIALSYLSFKLVKGRTKD